MLESRRESWPVLLEAAVVDMAVRSKVRDDKVQDVGLEAVEGHGEDLEVVEDEARARGRRDRRSRGAEDQAKARGRRGRGR